VPALFPSDWLADAPYEDRDLGVLKAGKESEVYLVSRTGPTRACLMAEKRFKPRLRRAFRNDYLYAGVWGEGTRHESRAIKKRTRFGQEHLQARWEANEWITLERLYEAGVTVPPPAERVENGYRMAFIGDGDRAAPRLADVDLDLGTARRVWRELQREIRLILDAELVHGDLSAFNVLWWHERPVIIDFSQAVDAVVHPAARDLLRRDVERMAGDLDAALALVGDSRARFARQVLSS
jgi:RIO kinase 1